MKFVWPANYIHWMWFVLSVCPVRECCTLIYIQSSWQSYTGEAAPRVVNMHGVRVVYMHEERGWIQH